MASLVTHQPFGPGQRARLVPIATPPGPRADGEWKGSKQICRVDALHPVSVRLGSAGTFKCHVTPLGLVPASFPSPGRASAGVDGKLPARRTNWSTDAAAGWAGALSR